MATPIDNMSEVQKTVSTIEYVTRQQLENLSYWPEPYTGRANKLVRNNPRLSLVQYDAFYKSKVCFKKGFTSYNC